MGSTAGIAAARMALAHVLVMTKAATVIAAGGPPQPRDAPVRSGRWELVGHDLDLTGSTDDHRHPAARGGGDAPLQPLDLRV